MGAHSFEDRASKTNHKTAEDAYRALCEEALEYSNCEEDEYNGTISTTGGFFMCSAPQSAEEYRIWYDDILTNKCGKWAGCACYETDNEWVFFGWAAC